MTIMDALYMPKSISQAIVFHDAVAMHFSALSKLLVDFTIKWKYSIPILRYEMICDGV